MVLSKFDRKMYDKICNYNFIVIYDNNFLLLFSESLDSKASKMLQHHPKNKKLMPLKLQFQQQFQLLLLK
jgi:hypothetical protein